jgi:hypothetical protein
MSLQHKVHMYACKIFYVSNKDENSVPLYDTHVLYWKLVMMYHPSY